MNRFVILMYHMISDPTRPAEIKYSCPTSLFRKHMKTMKDNGFSPISLNDIEDLFYANKKLPAKAFAVTFDDGFEDNYHNALPILSDLNIPATIFLTTDYIGSTNRWMQQPTFSTRQMLNWSQVQELASNNINIGAHTVKHPKLTDLDIESAHTEIVHCKIIIEDKLGKPCVHFAYPYGLFNTKLCDIVKSSGYSLACSTKSGFNNITRNPFCLHRIEVYGSDPCWKLKQKVTFGINDASFLYPMKYYKDRLVNHLTN